jgi:hypothetical protein
MKLDWKAPVKPSAAVILGDIERIREEEDELSGRGYGMLL